MPKRVDSTNQPVRIRREKLQRYAQEAEALTAITGIKWTVAAYMRYASDQMLGRHPLLIGKPDGE